MDVFFSAPQNNGTSIAVIWQYFSAGVFSDYSFSILTPTAGQTVNDLEDIYLAAQVSYASAHSYSTPNIQKYYPLPATPTRGGMMSATDKTKLNDLVASAPASYQTIVTQTGTAAPAVGSMAPVNSYPAGTTFTWARTGAGVYTLTASAAVFDTSGKTGVFITPPTNLNGSFRAVITSTTVITITTAVQSLAILGLLGFTATNTDAMLANTMVYVQTYP